MKKHHRNHEARAHILAEIERVYLQRMLENLDTWWPVYAIKNPTDEKSEVVRRLVALIDKRPRRGFSEGAAHGQPPRPTGRAELMPYLEPPSSVWDPRTRESQLISGAGSGVETTLCGRASGVIPASDFKWYDVEAKDRSDTQDQHLVAPVGAPGWPAAQGARFWTGFARLDSFVNDINPFDGSPADRVVHLAVLKITPPPPSCDVRAVFRTSLFVWLPHGAEILNDWGWFDDQDAASIKIDLCCAIQPDGGDFPDADAFTFTSAMNYSRSDRSCTCKTVDLVHSTNLSKGISPNVYLGIRLTLQGADCRLQTGFTQHALDAYFGFRYPNMSGPPGLFYSYVHDLDLAMG